MKKLLLIFLLPLFLFGQMNLNNNTVRIDVGGRVFVPAIYHIYGGFQGQAETIELTTGSWGMVTNATNTLWTAAEYDGIAMSGIIYISYLHD